MQLLAAKMLFVTPKRFPKSLEKASWRLQDCPKGVRGAPTRQQLSDPGPWGLPLTRRADPSCPPDRQDQQPQAPGATFCDMVKYIVLRCGFRGLSTFGGIKSGPVEKRIQASSFFWAFLLPSPKKGGG